MATLLVLRVPAGKRLYSRGTSNLPSQWQNKDAFTAFCFSLYLQWSAISPLSCSESAPSTSWCVQDGNEEQRNRGCFFYSVRGYLCIIYGSIQNRLDCAAAMCAAIVHELISDQLAAKLEDRWAQLVTEALKSCVVSTLTKKGVEAYHIEIVLDTGTHHIISGNRNDAVAAHAVTMRHTSPHYNVMCRFSGSDSTVCAELMAIVESFVYLVAS